MLPRPNIPRRVFTIFRANNIPPLTGFIIDTLTLPSSMGFCLLSRPIICHIILVWIYILEVDTFFALILLYNHFHKRHEATLHDTMRGFHPYPCRRTPSLGDAPIRARNRPRFPVFPEPGALIPENEALSHRFYPFLRRKTEAVFSSIWEAKLPRKRNSVRFSGGTVAGVQGTPSGRISKFTSENSPWPGGHSPS